MTSGKKQEIDFTRGAPDMKFCTPTYMKKNATAVSKLCTESSRSRIYLHPPQGSLNEDAKRYEFMFSFQSPVRPSEPNVLVRSR